MQQPNFATPPHGSAALLEIGNNPPSDAIHPTQHPPHNPRCAPPPSSPSAGPRTPATPSSPPAHSRSRKRLADSVITGTSKRETRALTPPPLRRPPRHRGASLPLRTSDGRAVDRVHRARSLPTASVRAGARANSRAHRSEARSSEVCFVFPPFLRALGTLAPRREVEGPSSPQRKILCHFDPFGSFRVNSGRNPCFEQSEKSSCQIPRIRSG